MIGGDFRNSEEWKARMRGVATLEKIAAYAAPAVAIFDGGQEKDRLAYAERELAVCYKIIGRIKQQNSEQRVRLRRAYKLLRKAGFTLKSL